MRQTQPELNVDDLARRKSWRAPRIIAAGLILAAIGAVAVLDRPAERVQPVTDFAVANAAERLLAVPTEDAASNERARAVIESLRSHFERSDEPAAAEDSMKPYGG